MVPVIGVEPIRYRYHWILSPARLPIPSHRQMSHFRGTLVLYHSPKIKSRAFEKKIKIYFLVSYNDEQRSVLRERLRAQGASPKTKRSTQCSFSFAKIYVLRIFYEYINRQSIAFLISLAVFEFDLLYEERGFQGGAKSLRFGEFLQLSRD